MLLELLKKKKEKEFKYNDIFNLKININSKEEFEEVQKLAFKLNSGWKDFDTTIPKQVLDEEWAVPKFVFISKYISAGFASQINSFLECEYKEVSLIELREIANV